MSDLDAMMEKLEVLEQGMAALVNVILEKLEGLEQGTAALQDAMGMVLEASAKPAAPPTPPAPPKPPIASYEQMYGPIEAAPVIPPPVPASPEPPRPGRLRRWLTKEERA